MLWAGGLKATDKYIALVLCHSVLLSFIWKAVVFVSSSWYGLEKNKHRRSWEIKSRRLRPRGFYPGLISIVRASKRQITIGKLLMLLVSWVCWRNISSCSWQKQIYLPKLLIHVFQKYHQWSLRNLILRLWSDAAKVWYMASLSNENRESRLEVLDIYKVWALIKWTNQNPASSCKVLDLYVCGGVRYDSLDQSERSIWSRGVRFVASAPTPTRCVE